MMRRTSWFKGWRLGLIAALLIGGGWWVRQHYFTPPPAPQVITAPVTRQDLEDTVLATGSIQAIQQVDIGAQASGQIRKLHVELGQSIHKGDLVAEIDSTKQQNDLRNAEAQLAVLAAQKRSRQAQLVQYELALQRTQALVKEDAGTRADLEAAQASVDTTRAALAELDAQIEQARIAVDTARTNLGYTRIVAPMDGVVIAVVRKAGQTVNALQSAPTLIKLAQLDTMLIRAQISEADVVKVRPDMPVYFTIMGEPDKRYDARLVAIEPSTDAEQAETSSTTSTSSTSSSTTSAIYYNGRFTVPNPEHKLRIDMTAQVSIVASRADNTLTVPATALGARGKDGRYTVKVLEGEAGQAQRVSQRQVRVGLNNRVQAQVLDGLKEGERVVIGDASANNASRSRGGPPMF
ncbi:efflux transporter periplasmic adaptor subunit [Aquabacterium olei]|uniref:Efflux transporter periplasmic adaptor subunit n=2 Tax=Aquabacterium olei TaxID=1296669 RepID=A0A2U8FW53_9BURK|nr:efflux RND transporter periplasmic adaptor subunit [Aquabacterium olei]AWI55240.1 efflux transporter periplasmic adaptor subunit [Aquabacterium olei]